MVGDGHISFGHTQVGLALNRDPFGRDEQNLDFLAAGVVLLLDKLHGRLLSGF
jgi:hypothetical protein